MRNENSLMKLLKDHIRKCTPKVQFILETRTINQK